MATDLDQVNQWDMTGLAITVTDLDVLDDLTVGDDLTVTGDLAVTGNVTVTGTLTSGTTLTAGAGVAGADGYESSVTREGSIITTRIFVDIDNLVGSATDLDIIGDSAAASANWGQITTAVNGVIIGGKVTCLEVPAGGSVDIDFYSSDVATGTQDVIITNAALGTETALVTSGGNWTSGRTLGMTGLPTANDYLYIVNGSASGGTFTAGKFLIELYGT